MTDIVRHHTAARMSQIVIHGETIYLAGQVGNRGDSVADQTRTCLEKVEALLGEAGSDATRILQCTIWLADMADFAEMNDVWDSWVPGPRARPGVRRGQTGASRTEGRIAGDGGGGREGRQVTGMPGRALRS